MVLAIVGVAGGAWYFYPGFHRAAHALASTPDNSPLDLRVEHSGPDLLLTWNRDAAGIRNALHGVLSITDGDKHERYDMDPGQLTQGSIVYSPISQDIQFQLEVTGKNNERTGSGNVRVLRRPSPLDDKTSNAKSTAPATPNASESAPAQNQAAVEETPAEKPAAPTAPKRQFDSAELSKRLRPATQSDLLDAPAPNVSGAPQAALPSANLSALAPAAPAAPKQDTKAAPTPRASGGQITPAVLRYKRDPEYPKLAQQMGQRGVVELIATIGVDGRVKATKVVKGPPMLQKPAQDAVAQWVYQPTLLNGTPVESETHIQVNFSNEK